MSARAADVLELLLPEAGARRQARARKAVTFLRLLASSASPRRATSVRLALAGARGELQLAARERLSDALADLITHHLAAALPPESFLDVGTPRRTHDRAWALLADERDEVDGLPQIPSPGEEPLEVAGRLVACAERLGLAAGRTALWRARLLRLTAGVRAGERAFLALVASGGVQVDRPLARDALAGAVACLLDRGAVLQAAALLREQARLVDGSDALARLDGWVRLLSGDEAGARARLCSLAPGRVRLPAALVALRQAGEDWLPLLAGVAARGRAPRAERVAERGDLGAAVLAVFALGPAGSARAVHVDCAPALRSALPAWLDGRDGACRRPGELEREMIARGEVVVAHRRGDRAPRGCLDAAVVRAVALAQITDRDGELRGWLRLELEHHLVPSPVRLRALARAWRDDLPQAPACVEVDPTLELAQPDGPPGHDPRAEILRALVDSVRAKTALRRWWALVLDDGRPKLVAEGGGALEDWRARPGGGRALRRALVAVGTVRFDQPDRALSLCADAASGLAVPVAQAGRVLGLVVVESARRKDVAVLQGGLERAAEAAALALRVAGFRAWHLGRWGHDVTFDVGVAATAALVRDLLAAASAPEPVTLSGPAGVGKRVLARWLHLEGRRAEAALLVHACGAHEPMVEERELFGGADARGGLLRRARAGTLVLDDPERRAPPAQARLERWLAEDGAQRAAPRLVLTSRLPLSAALESESVREDLAQRLQRLELSVPALAERREEIPTIVAGLARRFAGELERPAPQLTDAALALLWRQPWRGNVRELENVVYRLVLGSAEKVGLPQVEDVAGRFRIELVRRIPPREADPALLASALRCTRTLRGTPNKTRAALYLGWDPDTLGRRLAAEGLDAATLLA